MVLASLQVVIFGSVSFVLFWVLAVFPSFKALPLGRTAGAVAGAVLTVVLGVETPTEAYDAIDLSILGLLFGTMVVSVYMQQADMFKYLANLLSWRSRGSRDLLCRTCLLGAVSGALFTNDTCCLVLTSFILKLCHREKLPPLPFLVALATSANIGSAATPIGNPQNLVIAARSNISFSMFVAGMLPSVVVGIALNTVMLLLFYHKQLSPRDPDNSSSSSLGLGLDGSVGLSPRSVYAGNATKNATPWTPFQSSEELHIPHDLLHVARPSKREESHGSAPEVVLSLDTSSPLLTPKSDESLFHLFPQVLSPIDHDLGQTLLIPVTSASAEAAHRECKRIAWKCCVYFVACAMLVAFLLGYDLSWTSLTAAVCLMAIDFCDAGPNLDKVSYTLLVFFAGMFITIDGFNSTGIPGTIWDIMEPHARIHDTSGIIILTLVVILLSNVASNVPTVLLLGTRIAASALESNASVTRAWLFLAWASTIGGNFTLVGSAANLIVSEQAMKAQSYGYDLTFFSHLKYGLPSTLIVGAIGLPFIRG